MEWLVAMPVSCSRLESFLLLGVLSVLSVLPALAQPCHFEDSDGNCWGPEPRGVCGRPTQGATAALAQHAEFDRLCAKDAPYGFRPMCHGADARESLQMLRGLRDPATCYYKTCALVGASGTLLGSRLGGAIDKHDAVIRINFAPDGRMAGREKHAPHSHEPTWIADVGARTTWRVLTMEGYGYLNHYPRFWLKPPKGHGSHATMAGIPQRPLLAISCHTPTQRTLGRCRVERLRQVFDHPWSASYLINPSLMDDVRQEYFQNVKNQRTLSTGMTAVAFARKLCGEVHLYGFGNGSCGDTCYHYYDCGPTAGSSGTNQSEFLTNPRTSGGFHNFSAQASVLLRMVSEGKIVPHWGRCDRNLGDAPSEYLSVHRPYRRGKRGGGRGRFVRGAGRGRGSGKGGGGRGGGWLRKLQQRRIERRRAYGGS